MEAISSQQITVKCKSFHVIVSHRYNNIVRTNHQRKISILNQNRHIQVIGNKLIILPTKPPTPYHIEDVVSIALRSEWYDSIFSNDKKMENPPHSVHHFYILYYHQIKNNTSKDIF